MKYLKMIGLAAIAAMALTAFTAGSASATTLEVGGVTLNSAVEIKSSIKAGTSAVLSDTFGFSVNTCTSSNVEGKTSKFTGTRVSGAVSVLSFTNCKNPVTVHKGGTLEVEHIAGTTNGRVYSTGAEVTVWSALHNTYVNCKTGGELIGTLTGVASGHATMDIAAVLNCEPHLPTAKWNGTYTVTSPTGLGVSA